MMLRTVIILENICPKLKSNHVPLDVQFNALPTEVTKHVVPSYISLYDSGMTNVIYLLFCELN